MDGWVGRQRDRLTDIQSKKYRVMVAILHTHTSLDILAFYYIY